MAEIIRTFQPNGVPTVNVLYCTHDRGHGEKQYIRIRGRNIKFVRVSGCTLQETDMSINQTNWKTLTEKLLKFTARTSFITEDCPYPFGSLCRVNITYGYTLSSAKCIPLNLCFHKYGLYHGCITKSWEDEWDTEYEDKMEGLCGRYYHVESSDECPTTDSDDSDSDRNHYWRTPEEKNNIGPKVIVLPQTQQIVMNVSVFGKRNTNNTR